VPPKVFFLNKEQSGPLQVLRRLPGVTDANYRMLMDGVKTLADLAVSEFVESTALPVISKGFPV
jgi:hypothetical protein